MLICLGECLQSGEIHCHGKGAIAQSKRVKRVEGVDPDTMPGDNGFAINLFSAAGNKKGNKQYNKNFSPHQTII